MLIELTAVICAITGGAVLWINPTRLQNQAFGLLTVAVLAFLWLVYKGIYDPLPQASPPYPWHRANAACATLLPWLLWLLRESLIRPGASNATIFLGSLHLLGLAALWAPLTLSETFIFHDPESGRVRGIGYWLYTAIGLVAYAAFIIQTFRQTRRFTGIRRLELQYFALNMGICMGLGVIVTSLGNFFHLQWTRRTLFVIIIAAFSVTGWVIAARRVFDPRRIALTLSLHGATALLLGAGGFGLWHLYHASSAAIVDLIASFLFLGGSVFWLHRKLREWLGVADRKALEYFRRLVIESARTEPAAEALRLRFEAILREHCSTDFASILLSAGKTVGSGRLALEIARPGLALLRDSGWSTPESLDRQPSTPMAEDLKQYLASSDLALVVWAPLGSPTPSLILALGPKTTGWPYTYPEIERLQNIAELMDNILTRSRLTEQAALQARMEHLAMLSRGLAHDLKNLLTPVSSFLVHTDGRFVPDTPEAEVHAAARRSVRIMTDYVREALFFSERLAPKLETLSAARICQAAFETIQSRAAQRGVSVTASADLSQPIVGDAVLLQRLLANLLANAIDASSAGQHVALTARPARPGWVHFLVTDHGCGIAPEHLNRIFDAYFTTKEFGDDVRGFGLGLTIAQKIAQLHRGSISVESQLGRGTTLTVELPIAQPSVSAATTGALADASIS